MTVKQTDWKTIPLTQQAKKIDLDLTFFESQFEKIKVGHKPADMDDKWFIYYDNDFVYFHRSWTGVCIFKVKFSKTPDNKYSTTEFWVERDEKIYTIKDDDENRHLVEQLIKNKLLT